MIDKRLFNSGLSFEEYIKRMSDLKDMTQEIYEKLTLDSDLERKVKSKLKNIKTLIFFALQSLSAVIVRVTYL